MGIAQWVYVTISAVGLLVAAYLHGKPRGGNFNFWSTAIDTSLTIGILSWGGFFS